MPQASSPARSATDFASTLETASKIEAVEQPSEMREAFTDFVGQTLFGSMLTSMRKTVGKPAYMHGGRTEEVFQQQLDQHIVENLTKSSASSIADPMFELFNLQRRS
jgi:Rod binding domain-containing protein